MMDPLAVTEEPWDPDAVSVRYLPMQARVGDYVLFSQGCGGDPVRRGKILFAPQSALLILVRGERPVDELQ